MIKVKLSEIAQPAYLTSNCLILLIHLDPIRIWIHRDSDEPQLPVVDGQDDAETLVRPEHKLTFV